jgi:hypothetical protein
LSTDIEDVKAELANVFPLLRDSENHNAKLAKILADYAAELERVQEAFNEACDELNLLKLPEGISACTVTPDGDVFDEDSRILYSPDEARLIAIRLLAAADIAEGGQ